MTHRLRGFAAAALSASLVAALFGCRTGPDGEWPASGTPERAVRFDQRQPPTPSQPEPEPPEPVVVRPFSFDVPAVPALDPAPPFDDRLPARPVPVRHVPQEWRFDVEHYDIAVEVDFAGQGVRGSVAVTFRAEQEGLAELPLDAVDLTILAVRDASGRPIGFDHDGQVLRVRPSEAFPVDAPLTVRVDYEGVPDRGLFFNLPGPDDPGAARQAFTQGECIDTRHWLPCHDWPDDRATHALAVTVPEGMYVVGAGERLGSEPSAGSRETWRFRMDVPHVTYLITLVAGDYVALLDDGPVPLEYVVEPRDVPHAAATFRETGDILTFLGELTGRAYPYPRYAQTTVRNFMFGGMENISATTLTDTTVHPPGWEPVRRSTNLICHEAAHQWFGDLITCADFSHVWLNEGFASYCPALYTEAREGRDAFLVVLRGLRNGGLGAADNEPRPVVSALYAEPFDLFDGHTYSGSAVRLHMLRALVGREAFGRIVRRYMELRAGTVVRTGDFARVAGEVAGMDLGWWFQQWFLQPGYPRLKIRTKWEPERGGVVMTVEQTQTPGPPRAKGDKPLNRLAAGSVPAVYRLPLDIAFDLRNGGVVNHTVELTKRREEFVLEVPSEPRLVRPDPATALLARFDLGRKTAEWAQLVRLDPNPARRIDAAEALAKVAKDKKRPQTERESAAGALLGAVAAEGMPQVRVALTGQLSGLDTEAATAALVGETRHGDARVRIAALGAFRRHHPGGARTEAVRAALEDRHELVRQAAVKAIGRLKPEGAYELLLGRLDDRGWHAAVRVAVLEALVELGDERAFEVLRRFSEPGVDPLARGAAIRGLGKMGKARPEYRDAVLPHLRDSERHIRSRAASALGAIGDPNVIPILLEAFEAEPWHKTQDAMRRAIQACRKAAANDGRAVTVETARGLELRAQHTAAKAKADALRADAKKAQGAEKKRLGAEQRTARAEVRRLRGALDELGIGPTPKKPGKKKAKGKEAEAGAKPKPAAAPAGGTAPASGGSDD